MVTLQINGREVTVAEGSMVLDAAKEAGIQIPTLCHHESLPAYGACRICVCEVTQRGRTKLQAACTLPVTDGMEVNTDSDCVMKIRKMLAELMLARCPESSTIRKLANEIEPGLANKPMRLHKSDDLPSTFVGEGGCILCGMCVRLCNDVMKIGALAFENRGARRHVTTPFKKASEFCVSCGACSFICPTGAIELSRIRERDTEQIPCEFEFGMTSRKPIHISFPQAVPRIPVIDHENCINFKTGGCKVCEDNCEAEAIDHKGEDVISEIDVGAVIVSTGFDLTDPEPFYRYGYGRYDDVITALEFERMSHASGPTSGNIVKKDGRAPKAVAILHCIGSRDDNYQKYCSRVCCMYSLKFAHLIKEKTDAEVYNFYIDMRAFGKGYEEFYKRLLNEKVHFIRGKAAEITDVPESAEEEGKLIVVGEDTLLGMTRRIPVDMVILSTGMKPAKDADDVARALSLSCTQGTFYLEKHPKLAPVDTASDGIFLAGACQGPKDIPDSVAQGAAAAAGAMSLIDKGKVVLEAVTSEIDSEKCAGCQLCISTCPYAAIEFNDEEKISEIIEELCKGCGTCVAACPSGAAGQKNFEDDQIYAEIEGVLI